MAIAPRCDFCGNELLAFGALLFSPPVGDTVKKEHVCSACYEKIEALKS